MKIVSQNRITGTVEMIIEEADDFWVAYNLIAEGDSVTSNTWRKIQKRTASGATTEASRVKVVLEIKVESVEYDKEGSAFRLHGKNTLQNDYVRIGQFHTLEIEQKQQFVLKKDVWESMALDILKQAANPAASADLAVVLMQEGLANIYLVGNSVTKSRARVEIQISRKYGSAIAGYEVSLNNFFHKVLQAFLTHVDFTLVRCALIASPGFTKHQFRDYMVAEAERKQVKSILQNKHRLLPVRSSSGCRHSLNEVLGDSDVLNLIKDTKAAQEAQVLNVFFNMMTKDPDRACYGPKHVEVAHEQLAVQTLLITDDLFRNVDIPTRRKYVDLIESVKGSGGTAHVFSSMHVSGEQLTQLSGIAAILRFPLPDLDNIEM